MGDLLCVNLSFHFTGWTYQDLRMCEDTLKWMRLVHPTYHGTVLTTRGQAEVGLRGRVFSGQMIFSPSDGSVLSFAASLANLIWFDEPCLWKVDELVFFFVSYWFFNGIVCIRASPTTEQVLGLWSVLVHKARFFIMRESYATAVLLRNFDHYLVFRGASPLSALFHHPATVVSHKYMKSIAAQNQISYLCLGTDGAFLKEKLATFCTRLSGTRESRLRLGGCEWFMCATLCGNHLVNLVEVCLGSISSWHVQASTCSSGRLVSRRLRIGVTRVRRECSTHAVVCLLLTSDTRIPEEIQRYLLLALPRR